MGNLNHHAWMARRPRRAARGFSLIELMVALLVGMLVVGALMAGYYAVTVSNRNGQARAQVTEDASIALNMLRTHLVEAGYSRVVSVGATKFVQAYTGRAVFGCDGAFVDPSLDIGALTCAGTSGSDSLAVAYEADSTSKGNSLLSGGVPLDCLGNTLSVIAGPSGNYYLNYSRFYLATSGVSTHLALYCRGPGNNTGQALVENIEDLQIKYGTTTAAGISAKPVPVVEYVDAKDVADWALVVTVRVCVVAASTNEVMDDKTPYIDCQGNKVTPSDKRMYRAFTSTVVLHNRLG